MMNHRNVLVVLVVLALATGLSALEPQEAPTAQVDLGADNGVLDQPLAGTPALPADPESSTRDALATEKAAAGQAIPLFAAGVGDWGCEEPTGFDTGVRCAPACGLGGSTCTDACAAHECGREGCLYAEGSLVPTCHCLVPF